MRHAVRSTRKERHALPGLSRFTFCEHVAVDAHATCQFSAPLCDKRVLVTSCVQDCPTAPYVADGLVGYKVQPRGSEHV